MSKATVLHAIEKKIISSLRDKPAQSITELSKSARLSIDQTRRGVEWLRHKGLAEVSEYREAMVSLDRNGLDLPDRVLPERKLLGLLAIGGGDDYEDGRTIDSLKDTMGPSLFGAAMGIVKRNGWVEARPGRAKRGTVLAMSRSAPPPPLLPGEATLLALQGSRGNAPISASSLDADDLRALLERPRLARKDVVTTKTVALTGAAKNLDVSRGSGGDDGMPGAIDVGADVPRAPRGRVHPLKDVISEIKEIFTTMGFSEVSGGMIQTCFWNFDALLTPQDHPSREMQDTFYLDDRFLAGAADASPGHVRHVARVHSGTWHQKWDEREALRMVLRTHTTCVTLRHLMSLPKDAGDTRLFSLGRVFRNEKTSYKHLAEFTQVEGVVHEKGSTIRNLMGIQAEFYRRLGLPRVKFWPTFFPYTEPSFQSMVYNENLGKWVELFGMGVFHPYVTRGLRYPVLAWGGGVERIAMLKYGLDDVREFYANNVRWLRSARRVEGRAGP